MAISSVYVPVKLSGDGVQDEFSFDFRCYENTDIRVTWIDKDTDEVIAVKTLGTHYTVTLNPITSEGGVVTFDPASIPDSDTWVLMESVIPVTQPTRFGVDAKLSEKSVEKGLDRQTRLIQQGLEAIGRALKFSAASGLSDIDVPALESLKYLRSNAGETALEFATPIVTETEYGAGFSYGADADKDASPSAGDLYFATDTNIFYRCITGGSWTAAINTGGAVSVASATITDIGAIASQYASITGTTTITGLGTITAGVLRFVKFTGALTLTHNATSLILPGAANITTAAGDTAVFISEGSGNWRCLHYQKANGQAVVAPAAADGLAQNFLCKRASASTITVTADSIFINGKKYSNVSDTVDITVAGAGGLDIGSESAGVLTVYYVWLIVKDSDGTVEAMISLSATAPTMPVGFTDKFMVSMVLNDASNNLIPFKDYGQEYWYDSWVVLVSGAVTRWTAINTTKYIPSTLGNIAYVQTQHDGNTAAITNDNTVDNTEGGNDRNKALSFGTQNNQFATFNIITANTLYGGTGGSGGVIYLAGFRKTNRRVAA